MVFSNLFLRLHTQSARQVCTVPCLHLLRSLSQKLRCVWWICGARRPFDEPRTRYNEVKELRMRWKSFPMRQECTGPVHCHPCAYCPRGIGENADIRVSLRNLRPVCAESKCCYHQKRWIEPKYLLNQCSSWTLSSTFGYDCPGGPASKITN